MKKARAFNLETNDPAGLLSAADLSDDAKTQYRFECAAPDCKAAFHRVKGHPTQENTEKKKPFFRKNPGQVHTRSCSYDYESRASKHKELTFLEDGVFHLRANFPMGSAPVDRWSRGNLTNTQRQAVGQNTDKVYVRSVEHLTKFLEDEFESLENPALDNLVLHYQGEDFSWPDIFSSSDLYRNFLYQATRDEAVNDNKGLRSPNLVVVKPTARRGRNNKGKSRVFCEKRRIGLRNGRSLNVQPVLVFANDHSLTSAFSSSSAPCLVSARPFVKDREALKEALVSGEGLMSDIQVFLYMKAKEQLSFLKEDYWPSVPGQQKNLDLKPS